MKNTLILLFILIGSSLQSQISTFGITMGTRHSSFLQGTFNTVFIDESPSMDFLATETITSASYTSYGLGVEFGFGKSEGYSSVIYADWAFGINQMLSYGYNGGWNFHFGRKFIFRPNVNIAWGNNRFKLGEIENNAAYIQINDKEYYQDKMGVRLRNFVFIYGPQLDLKYNFSGYAAISFNVSYDLAQQFGTTKVTFIPDDKDRERYPHVANAKVDLESPNLILIFNDQSISNFTINHNVLRFSIGLHLGILSNSI